MKAKVLIPFTDKYTGKKYIAGDTVDMTVSRFNEIIKKGGYVEAAETEKAVKIEK
jgi:hypothetical protein